jgi:aconitate hydratase
MTQFKSVQKVLTIAGKSYTYISLKSLEEMGFSNVSSLPFTLKVLLENLLRHHATTKVNLQTIESLCHWNTPNKQTRDIPFMPSRVLMQDFTGVPAVVDLAAMRDAFASLGGDAKKINPLNTVDLVIDHSLSVDHFGSRSSFETNKSLEYARNKERYTFLKWGQKTFQNFRVVPPGAGICHQVNLEYLAPVIQTQSINNAPWAFPDTLVGTDSHTTMINALGVLGWGVGGIEAEAAMLGQPCSMRIPEVVGVKLSNKLPAGATATDLVLTITQRLREKNVVGKFVEYFGPGLSSLTIEDRATLANMAPEYGATCGFFPIDAATLKYLHLTGREAHHIQLVEAYAKEQGLWHSAKQETLQYTSILEVDLSTIETSLAGPKRPQDRLILSHVPQSFQAFIKQDTLHSLSLATFSQKQRSRFSPNETLENGAVVIAAITSCTNTSNPNVMIAAGLLAKKALSLGLKPKSWVKTSLAPGSKVVVEYLEKTGLQKSLDAFGFNLVGYGCTTCIGNSGPLIPEVEHAVQEHDLTVASVLSGNRNFEGRINPLVKANYLASPPLVVAYAIAGSVLRNLARDPIATAANGKEVYLSDLWPSQKEIDELKKNLSPTLFQKSYASIFNEDEEWRALSVSNSDLYTWSKDSTYIKKPPYFKILSKTTVSPADIQNAKALAILGDSITTDHISPAGMIAKESPAGQHLMQKGIAPKDFNSYGARRGNHEVMVRGTFANIRIQNEMVPGNVGGKTLGPDTSDVISIYDAAMRYQAQKTPLVIIAGTEYGTGSSRDWAAKGTKLLGVKAVIAESFERIHRANLIGMGVLPLTFQGETRKTLGLNGSETYTLTGLASLSPGGPVSLKITYQDGSHSETPLTCCIETEDELQYYKNGGILPFVLHQLLKEIPPQ